MFIFISLGYSRKLVLIPFVLDVKIKNRFLVDIIDLLFEPINLILTPLGYLVALSGPMIILMGLLVFLIGFILFVIESYFLSKLIIFIFKKAVPENFFENVYFIIRKKISGSYDSRYGNSENSKKFEKIFVPSCIFYYFSFRFIFSCFKSV
ncbi:MAG: hypothetical protein KAI67_03895 [Candidatus Pacebacteria bacterium]|nr:hypothetical protein [Candidatus Paceibacterota bacterium]